MKNKISIYFLLLCFHILHAQVKEPTISVSFSDKPIKECFLEIESKCKEQFYFDSNWSDLNQKITASFTNEPVSLILNTLLKETNLNFFHTNNTYIITQNNFIYNQLNTSLVQTDSLPSVNQSNPLFFEKLVR